MDFDNLPDTAFLKIFRCLPFGNRIQFGRVSKSFHRMATISISETRILRLNDPIFDRLTPAALFEILKLCSKNLEVIKFLGNSDYIVSTLVVAFSHFSCPRLQELEISTNFVTGNTIFHNIIRNNPNLRTLLYENTEHVTTFPTDVISNLERIKLSFCNDSLIDSMVSKCPNLKQFEVTVYCSAANQNLDRFFASSNQIEILCINYLFAHVSESVAIWRLENLKILSFRCETPIEDSVLVQIATAFPNLETLSIRNLDVTSHGLSALALLTDLRKLVLSKNESGSDLDEGARNVALHCPKLNLVQFFFPIGPAVLKSMIRFCPMMQNLGVTKVTQVHTEEDAIEVARSIGVIDGRKMTIRISSPDNFDVWDSAGVKEFLGEAIRFERGWYTWNDD